MTLRDLLRETRLSPNGMAIVSLKAEKYGFVEKLGEMEVEVIWIRIVDVNFKTER